ncbi:MAG: hypothetical protein ABMA01_10960 [Chthoniobacteraceae bacterium]
MTNSEKTTLLKTNTLCWFAAIALPAILHFALASTGFPWPVILPLLLIGPMLASNKILTRAIGDTTDDSNRR